MSTTGNATEATAACHGRRAAGIRVPRLLFSFFLLLAIGTAITGCESTETGYKLEGRFRNLNQGEFYLFSLEEGWKDTIGVRDGRFVYEKHAKDTATLALMFPNFSVLPIFVHAGAHVKIEGDASHLRETEIKGTKENEEMTAFRLRANKQTPPETTAAAQEYIEDHPESPVSIHLFRHYFLETASPDYQLAAKLAAKLLEASPGNGMLVRLNKQLASLKSAPENGKMPSFVATDMNGKRVSNEQLKADVNVVLGWASWNYESTAIIRAVRKLQKEYSGKMAVVSICIDANTQDSRNFFRRDSITWPNICDGALWQSPVMQKMGFATMPANIIADKRGKILARNLPTARDIEDKLRPLLKQ